MNETTAQLIRELSQKLGTTTEHLWSVLVAQARVDFISSTIQYLLILVGGYFIYRIFKKTLKELEDNYYEDHVPLLIIVTCISGVLFAVYCVIGFGYLPMYIASVTNPEYWALKQIIK